MKRIRAGAVRTYRPVLMDKCSPASRAVEGQRVKVVKLHGCPPPGTMGHCHIADAETGAFLGLVCINSLSREDN